jgi:hypothetical protein
MDFENKNVTYLTSLVRDNFETKISQPHKSILSRYRNRIKHVLEALKHD